MQMASEPLEHTADLTLEAIIAPVEDDMQAVNRFITRELHSDVVLINTIGNYIISTGGKRLRPVALLLSAGACEYQGGNHIALAAIIEFIHTATLLHDDVVDDSDLRRGQQTANGMWGNQASVLVGDFLYSRAFQQMVRIDNMAVMDILADTTNTIAEGEVMQLINSHSAELEAADYYETIRRKTAILFEAACRLGAVISGAPEAVTKSLANYGLHMGIAFQLIDDVLDYSGDVAQTGKNVGDDLADGKATLPMIRALQTVTGPEREVLVKSIEDGAGKSKIDRIIGIISATDALEYTRQQAAGHTRRASQALAQLPDSIYKQSLANLTEFFIHRLY